MPIAGYKTEQKIWPQSGKVMTTPVFEKRRRGQDQIIQSVSRGGVIVFSLTSRSFRIIWFTFMYRKQKTFYFCGKFLLSFPNFPGLNRILGNISKMEAFQRTILCVASVPGRKMLSIPHSRLSRSLHEFIPAPSSSAHSKDPTAHVDQVLAPC